MESLISVINVLQGIFKNTGTEKINLPQIVVVGSQSCGKSSVLESFVKKSFLPRGSGIVTRCPIILQLKHTDRGNLDEGVKEWCTFSTDPGTKYTDFEEVREEIEKRTNEMAGSNKGIAMEPIVLEVSSPNVITLTVVDLPGVVKNPVGDQPVDIEQQVLDLIKKYIENPNSIILAVSPANADIATSDSIKIAKEVDPNGDRTLAVVTKLDLMDKGTDASKVLSGEVIHVKLGIVGVVNRSQFDIDSNKTVENSLEDEETFFRKTYPKKVGEIGSPYLAKRLQQLLMKHIQNSLPDLIKSIGDRIAENEATQHRLGPEIADGSKEKFWVLMEIVNEFIQQYKSAIIERPKASASQEELFALQIFDIDQEFSENLNCQDSNLDDLEDKISLAIRHSVNIERYTSIEDVFKSLARQQIMFMEKPAIEYAEAVHGVLYRAVESCLKDKRFTQLNSAICRVTRRVLNSQLKDTKRAIKEHMKIQTGMITSADAEFIKLLNPSVDAAENGDVQDALTTLASVSTSTFFASFPLGTTTNGNNQSVSVKKLITTYYDVMKKHIVDFMPKLLLFHLFECTMEKLRNEIKSATAGMENELVSEPENIVRLRQETEENLKNLYIATEVIGGIQSGDGTGTDLYR